MHVEVLTNGWERGRGAMLRSSLEQNILVFCYPQPVSHLFHTFFCPPMRITALDAEGEIAFSKVFTAGTFVRLPPARIVLESAPDVSPEEALDIVGAQYPSVLANPIHGDASGLTDEGIAKLFCLALIEPMKHLAAFKDKLEKSNDDVEALRKFPLWKQGQILESAYLVVENSDVPGSTVPVESLRLARRICARELDGKEPEMIAAGLAGGEWPDELKSPRCLKCQTGCTWRQVITRDDAKWRAIQRRTFGHVPEEMQWRYKRPENHVPLCRNCARLEAWQDSQQRHLIGLGLWGNRFGALLQWHDAAVTGNLPPQDVWDRIEYPLWPEQFGGDSWATGSGAWQHAVEMRSPTHVKRRQIHEIFLQESLGIGTEDVAVAMGEEPPEPARLSKVSASELTELIMAS